MKPKLITAAIVATVAALPSLAADYKPVTDVRLANPEPENWLLTKGNYAGWSYSALDQINTSNVRKLRPVWSAATGINSGQDRKSVV